MQEKEANLVAANADFTAKVGQTLHTALLCVMHFCSVLSTLRH